MIATQTSAAQQQKFKVMPHDLQVLEGSEAVLRCEVSNLAGQVQWTKDGFALGKCLFISYSNIVLFFTYAHGFYTIAQKFRATRKHIFVCVSSSFLQKCQIEIKNNSSHIG